MAADLIKYFLQHASVTASKSSILSSLAWVLLTLGALAATCIVFRPEPWVTATVLAFVGFVVLVIAFGFIFGQLKNPDSLRSEHYALRKMEIGLLPIGSPAG